MVYHYRPRRDQAEAFIPREKLRARERYRRLPAFLCALLLSGLLPSAVSADGLVSIPTPSEITEPPTDHRPAPSQGSDASFDPRLPPVLPGEIVHDNGRPVRTWSTAGSPSVGAPPTAPAVPAPGYQLPTEVGVIVDTREGEKKPYRGPKRW